MSEQVENTSAVDTAAENTATATSATPNSKSFQCISPKSDWHILGIAFFTSIIIVIIYHFTIMAVNEFCTDEEDKVVSCYCHRVNGDEDTEKEEEGRKQRRKAFFDKLTPEQRDHLKTLKTKEERREYLRSIFKNKGPKDRPIKGKGPRKDRQGKRFAPPRQPRLEAPAQD